MFCPCLAVYPSDHLCQGFHRGWIWIVQAAHVDFYYPSPISTNGHDPGPFLFYSKRAQEKRHIDLNIVYSNTDYGIGDDTNALEVYANYKF